MSAVAIAACLIAIVAAIAPAAARWIDPDEPPTALGGIAALAAVVVAGTGLASIWRFDARALTGLVVVAGAAGLLRAMPGHRHGGPPIPASDAPSRLRVAVLVVLAAALSTPLLLFPVPLDTDAQGFGHLALAIRDGGTIDSLAPYRPGIAYLYSPGALLVAALLSSWIPSTDMSATMAGLGAAAVWLFAWGAWDFGRELARCGPAAGRSAIGAEPDRAWAASATLTAAASAGLWTALLDSHVTATVGLLCLLGFLTAVLRAARTGRTRALLTAGLLLAAIPMAHADTAVIATLAGIACIVLGLRRYGPQRWSLGAATVGSGLVAIPAAAPWLVHITPLVQRGLSSPYGLEPSNWRAFLLFNGAVVPLAVLPGLVVARRARLVWTGPMALWLLLVLDLGVVGLLPGVLPAALLRFNYPFSIAWHGPIVPCVACAAALLVRAGVGRRAPGPAVTAALALLMSLPAAAAPATLALSHRTISSFGAFSTHNDVAAMRWLRDSAPRKGRVLNYPGNYEQRLDWEAHWAPVVTERDCVYFRMQLFFTARPGHGSRDALADAYAEQRALVSFWRDPADTSHATSLRQSRITYVLVPEVVTDPSSLARSWRWQPPVLVPGVRSRPADAPYLTRVFAAGGAEVYEVLAEDQRP